jgi:hypothetical protein
MPGPQTMPGPQEGSRQPAANASRETNFVANAFVFLCVPVEADMDHLIACHADGASIANRVIRSIVVAGSCGAHSALVRERRFPDHPRSRLSRFNANHQCA